MYICASLEGNQVFMRRQAIGADRNRPPRIARWLTSIGIAAVLTTIAIAAVLLIGPSTDATTNKHAVTAPTRAPVVATQNAHRYETALATLKTLPIKGRAPKTGYSRAKFGPAWSDDVNVPGGHNGCDTRNDILRRDLIDITLKPNSNGCKVLSGTLIDPYSGKTIPFTRGENTSAAVQIDHMVALSDAWQKGAQQLDQSTRQDFANDPRNLQATSAAMNKQKGDADAATWLPPNKAFRCTFVSRQVEVKAAYGLWVTQAEHDAIARVLTGCGATSPVGWTVGAPAAYRLDGPEASAATIDGTAQAAAQIAPAAPR